MKAFSIDDIREVFEADLEAYISTTREHLGQYLSPEGAITHLDSPARHAHTMKGVAATVHAWGLAWFGEDLEVLYEVARSFHHSEPERAREIVGFIHQAIPHWQDMASLSLGGEFDAAFARYGELRARAEAHWGGYLEPRQGVPFSREEEEGNMEPVVGFDSDGENTEATTLFHPDLISGGTARSVSQPKLRVVRRVEGVPMTSSQPEAPKPVSSPGTAPESKTVLEVEKTRTVSVATGLAGAARRVAAPKLTIIKEEEPSDWGLVPEQECVGALEGVQPEIAASPLASAVPGILQHVIAPELTLAQAETSEWDTPVFEPESAPAGEEPGSIPVDNELVEIFREEARSYVEEVSSALTQLRHNLGAESTWLDLRRLCHTLKGSAATVGLSDVSERARMAEQLARAAVEDVSARTMAQAVAIGELTAGIAGLLRLPWATDTVAVELIAIDRDLANAFCLDAFEQIDSLEAALLAWERGESPETQRRAAYRAFHTLKGAANSIGLTRLGANLHLAEDLLDSVASDGAQELFGFLLLTVDQLRGFATSLQADLTTEWVYSWDDFVAQLSVAKPSPVEPAAAVAPVHRAGDLESSQAKAREHELELIRAFALDAKDQSVQCEAAVLAWERGESAGEQVIAAYRAFHTLKGAATSVGLGTIGAECHAVETLLDGLVQNGKAEPRPELIAFLLAATDQISTFADQVQVNPETEWSHDWQRDVLALVALLAGEGETAITPAAPQPVAIEQMEAAPAVVDYIRVKSSSVHQLLNQVGELVVERNRFAAKLDRAVQLRQLIADNRRHLLRLVENFQDSFEYSGLRRSTGFGGNLSSHPASHGTAAEFSELEMDRYDEFNMLSRALTEVADDLGQVTVELEGLIDSFRADEKRFAVNSRMMQEDITALTSQPIEGLFRRLERSFRDALQAEKKEAILRFEGASATLDRSIIERLHTPLLHLVRNAVAHGIESPSAREGTGKPRQGTVVVSASQSSNQIIITVRDDGAGIASERVLQRARERGLVDANVAGLSREEILHLLFTPGFSTAQEISNVAGRGVGMDIVKAAIEELKGSISAEWNAGAGTTWKIQLPLTLAVSEAIIVELEGQEFALPLNFTASGLLIEPARISSPGENEIYTLPDGQELPLLRLGRIFGRTGKEEDLRGVILSLGDARAVLVVDRVLARREIVVKGLDSVLASHSLLEGATLDSQGRPLLILSAPALLRIASQAGAGKAGAVVIAGRTTALQSETGRITAMVVDDSLSVRTVQNRLLTDLGCDVILANDGLDALEKLRHRPADIIFTDLEMPRMNGYDLISAIRVHAEWGNIPMVLVTSRSAQKHLDKALQLGANACLTKPFTKEDLQGMLGKYVVQGAAEELAA